MWARKRDNIPPVKTLKYPLKVNVWGMMSHSALSELHFIPRDKTVNTEYYIEGILKKVLMPTLKRKRKDEPIYQRKVMKNMSKAIFEQDGPPAHTSKRTQEWCLKKLKGFWPKEVWPANSPDLNPIENLWAILQSQLDSMPLATNEESLKNNLKLGWSQITEDILGNLIASMPNRIKSCSMPTMVVI